MPFCKISSREITNYQYLVKIGKTDKPVVMSTGMSDIAEIRKAINVLNENSCCSIILIHCDTEYLMLFKDVNKKQ